MIARSQSQRVAATAAALHAPPLPPPPPPTPTSRRLRIGYLSTDIRQHPLSYLMRGVFAMLDRAEYEAFVFAATASDGSALREQIASATEHFIDISTLPTLEALSVIRRAQLHVLVDLNGMSRGL